MQERDLEKQLVNNVTALLLELGKGFAFLGNQYHLEVGGEDFYIDLLFYNLNLRCYVVVELKTGDFKGIDGILSVCPYYNKPSQEGLYQHFKAIAAATELPVVLYNVPGRTGVNMTAETTVRLARDCKNIVAIKEASGKLEQVDEIIKNKPRDFDVISGDDALTFPMVSCGAVGVISVIGNALPKEFSKMIRLQMRGEYDPARKIHHRFIDLFSLLFVDGNPAGVKAMLHEMGFIQNKLRLPLVPMQIKNMQRMSEILKELKI